MKKIKSLEKRILALLLSIIMVLGMLPAGAGAVDNSSVYGTVDSLSNGISISGEGAEITATFAGSLNWVAADPSIGRNADGWWAGIKVTAPETVDMEKAQFTINGAANSFNAYKDSADDAETHYICIWKFIDGEKLRVANLDTGVASYEYTFDWDGDNSFEQKVYINFDADQTVLYNNDSTQAYPAAALGYGKVELLTEGASITNNEAAAVSIAYNNAITIDWVAADTSIGRYQDGWWAGFKVTAPVGMTEDQLKAAQFTMRSGIKSFWDNKDTQEGADVHYVSIWVPLNDLLSGPMDDRTYKFDWNNDGIFEQCIALSLDSTKITLTKNGTQVYPVLGQVSSYNGGVVTGSGTGIVNVLVEDVTLNWSEADASIGRTQGWWAGIRVEAPAGFDSTTLRESKLQVRRNESDLWENAEVLSFWDYKDSADDASVHHIGLWLPVSPSIIAEYTAAGKNITRWYRFDWNNDGTYEQEITFSIDPTGNIILNKVDQTGFGFAVETPADIWVGDVTYTNVAIGGQGDGAVTYEVIGGDAATVDSATGELTFSKAGTVTVKATKAEDSEGYYREATAQYTITAVKEDQYPKFETTSPGVLTYAPGLTYENTVKEVLGGTVTYSIVDEDRNGTGVATIDPATGKLTIMKAGTVTVKAVISEDANYNGAETSYTIVINKADQTGFAFENAPAELTWQEAALDALTLINGKGDGAVTWLITSGTDIASVDQDGKITLLKAGSFTIQAKKAEDDCYNASDAITATILVNPAAQTGFGFAAQEAVITYNDKDSISGEENKYTLVTSGGQAEKADGIEADVVYSIVPNESGVYPATLDNGVLTILESGEITVEAYRKGDERYADSETKEFTLTVLKDDQDFDGKETFEDAVSITYGTLTYGKTIDFADHYHIADAVIKYTLSNEDFAQIDEETGVVTFKDYKVGSVTVTASVEGNECYNSNSASYTITVSYLETEAMPTVDEGWHTEAVVTVYAPEGYTVSKTGALDGDWGETATFDEDDGIVDGAENTATVYLKDDATGYITNAKTLNKIKVDTTGPADLNIIYQKDNFLKLIFNKIFLMTNKDITVSFEAKDDVSGIKKVEYSLDNGVTFTEVVAENGVYQVLLTEEARYQIVLRVTNNADLVAERRIDGDKDLTVVYDNTNPEIVPAYVGQYKDVADIYHTNDKDFAIEFTVNDDSYDLMNKGSNDTPKNLPIILVNGVAYENAQWGLYEKDGVAYGKAVLKLAKDYGEGEYDIQVIANDRLNESIYEQTVYVDWTALEITPVEFAAGNEINVVDGRCYYDEAQIATIVINEPHFNAADAKITITANGEAVDVTDYIETDWVSNDNKHTLVLKFSEDANYSLDVAYTDIPGNTAPDYKADLFTVDTKAPTGLKIVYESDLTENAWPDFLEGLFGFAKDEMVVTISAEDATAGIKQLTYDYGNGEEPVATNGSYTFKIPAERRNQVTFTAMDYSGWTTTVDNEGKTVIVDSINPQMFVTYSTENRQDQVDTASDLQSMESTTADTRFVYSGKFSATLSIEEANFWGSQVQISVTCDGNDYEDYSQTDWTDVEHDGKLYREKVLTFTDDGDYVITVTYVDESTNAMDWSTDEFTDNKGTKTYVSNIHTIDTVAPVVTVSYVDKDTDVANVNYHSENRTATITVVDRNFRPNEIDFQVKAVDVNKKIVEAFDYESLKLKQWVNGTAAVWAQTAEDTWKTQVEIPFAIDANYEVAVDYQDIAKNEAVVNDFEKNFTVDHKAPENLSVTYSTHLLDTVLEAITFGYWDAPRMVTLKATDLTAGVEYFTVTATAEGPSSATKIENGLPKNLVIGIEEMQDGLKAVFKGGDAGFLTADAVKVTEENGTVSMQFEVPAQFRGEISFTATDMGYLCSENAITDKTIVVDTVEPTRIVTYKPAKVVMVEGMTDMEGYDPSKGITDDAKEDSYVMYFCEDAVANIQITEANFSKEGVKVFVNGEAATLDNEEWTQGNADDIWTNTLTIKDEGDYIITMTYTDRSNNQMVDYTSQRIVVDKTAPKIDVKYGAALVDGKNTRNYFADTQTATITVTEHNFRADDVVIKVTARNVVGDNKVSVLDNKGNEVVKELKLNADGTVEAYSTQGAARESWSAYESIWRRADDTYEIVLTFADFANYTFDIEYQDLATNTAADYVPDLFTVDNAVPYDLEIVYSKNIFEVILDKLTFGYYQAQMDVTISATDNTAGVDHFEYSYLLADNVSSVNAQGENIQVTPTENGNRYTATFKIPMEALTSTTQFNGSVNFTAYDRSGNQAAKDDEASVRVIVDNIAPTANISYNAPVQTANGISYYDGNINATITINEANFDAADVKVTVTKDGASYPVNVSWRDNSVDTHTGTFTLTADGDYIVSVAYTDKSQNTMQSYQSNQLTLDATMPVIEVSNIKANSANKDEAYSFVITVNDTNLDASTLLPVLKAVVQKEGGVYASKEIDLGEPVTVVNGKTYTYTVEDLPEDGLYTLTCTVQDMSANKMTQVVLEDGKSYEQVQFSINRNGSAFGYGNPFTEDLVGKYFIYSVDEDIVIVEVNVDPIEEYKVTLNGEELTEGEDYTTAQTSNAGEWSKRTYTIKKALFEAEGEYNIIVSSVDKAQSTAYSDVKNLTLAFVVDQTKPVLTITGMEAGGRYQTDAQTVTLIPSDEGGRLNSLKVVILDASGEPLKDEAGADISVRFELTGEELLKYLEENDGKVTFTIPEGLNNQVKIICNDCAMDAEGLTNEYNELFTRVTVSQNQFVIFYANTPLFVGTIIGVLAIIALIIFLIKRKKDKKTTEKTK